jgi:hypothetical protein
MIRAVSAVARISPLNLSEVNPELSLRPAQEFADKLASVPHGSGG